MVDLAAALGITYRAGLQLVADTLELRYRLPRLWALVQTGTLAAWKARQRRRPDHPPLPAGGLVRGPTPDRPGPPR